MITVSFALPTLTAVGFHRESYAAAGRRTDLEILAPMGSSGIHPTRPNPAEANNREPWILDRIRAIENLVSYSVRDLLQLLRAEGGERLQIHVGLPPVFVIKREDYEVEGPIITEQDADNLFRTVADSRHLDELLERGISEFVYELHGSRFRVCAKKEYGNIRLDFTLVTA